ncbi:HAMP domain-containing histidine kinase [Gordonia sp. PP30]|uniref:sensor histidine kinase n=1 Tax=unclassified Gordonia (in: high G+C Gram-positive bacteria) TaxID=2657482 RepID=UPI0020005925|nr:MULTISPECIES: HAMP domain-containing sensor histidine kinase [unclassified Gordonia (in: high G+C Gram-positive bacteria)]UQE73967.1 HAMP domain-containing histidine kinase [Gordonia sp. PP30]
MLSGEAILQILLIAAGAAVAVTVAGLLIARWRRRDSIAVQLWLVGLAAPLSMVLAVTAIAAQMYVSRHDLQVLLWVAGVSAVLSVAAALFLGYRVRAASAGLSAAARRVGDGQVVDADPTVWREFAEVSRQLAAASRELAEARRAAEALDATRRQFFAWVSHDLRTPLTGLRAMAEVLEEGATDDPQEYYRRIRLRVDSMNKLVDDLFALARLDEAGLILQVDEVELLDVVSDAVAEIGDYAAERRLRVVHDGVAGRVVRADPAEMTRVLVNLLSNSIRFAPAGSEVTVSAETADAGGTLISVTDRGPGVPIDQLDRIFEVGWRADAARGGPAGEGSSGDSLPASAGIGLPIVRGIVDAHGGEVRAINGPDGFRVTAWLPG